MWALLALFAAMLPCFAADVGELTPLIDRLRANPDDRQATIRAINSVLRPWLDDAIAPHGYSPGPATLASKLNADLLTAVGAGRMCSSDRQGVCVGPVRVLDVREPYFMVVRTSIWLPPCGFEEAAYVYEWSDSRWKRRLALDDEPTVSGPPRQFAYFDVSAANGTGRRVVASAALLRDCEHPQTAAAEMRVFTFDDRATSLVVFERRTVVLEEAPRVRAEPSRAQFEWTVASVSREPETRRAVNTYALDGKGARRVQPVARTVRNFVEEWLTTPWEYARSWSRPDQTVAQAHEALFGDIVQGDFLTTTGCADRVSEVGLEKVAIRTQFGEARVPEVYLKVQTTASDTYVLIAVSTEADEDCE